MIGVRTDTKSAAAVRESLSAAFLSFTRRHRHIHFTTRPLSDALSPRFLSTQNLQLGTEMFVFWALLVVDQIRILSKPHF